MRVKNHFGYFLTGMLLLAGLTSSAQSYPENALLFSRTGPGGSARIQALGGAQTAIGGDYSSAHSNPAGLGMFNRSEFTFSLGLTNNNTASSYGGQETNDKKTVFNIPGLSYVHHMPDERGSFLGGSFAFSLTRSNDFNRAVRYVGQNTSTSIVDYFIDQAYGHSTYQFEDPQSDGFDYDSAYFNRFNDPTGLAYFNYLIGPFSSLDPSAPSTIYFTDAGFPEIQQEEIVTKGATNQWNISYGANFSDKYFFGAGIGITSLKYRAQKDFTEVFDNPDTIRSLLLTENTDIKGTGINATFGAIVRPVDFLQLGLSYKTPTVTAITETYNASMSTNWNNFDYYGDGSEILRDNTNDPVSTDAVISEYSLVSPSKLNAGLTLLSKIGFITADIEMTNPGRAKYKSSIDGISYDDENANIKSVYSSTVNYRIGAEYRFDIFRVRAGYGMMANTFRKEYDIDNKVRTLSAGLGIRKDSFYIDFALVNNASETRYQPYTFFDGTGPVVNQDNSQTTGVITVGFTFGNE